MLNFSWHGRLAIQTSVKFLGNEKSKRKRLRKPLKTGRYSLSLQQRCARPWKVQCKFFEGIAQSFANNGSIDDKLTAVQQNIMIDVERKLDEKFSSFLNEMKGMLERKG
jgi:hypothetical protein